MIASILTISKTSSILQQYLNHVPISMTLKLIKYIEINKIYNDLWTYVHFVLIILSMSSLSIYIFNDYGIIKA